MGLTAAEAAAPRPPSSPAAATSTPQTTAAAGDTENYAREAEPETDTQTYTVAAGDCLSVICRRFYGYGTPAYYNAVAKYNGIKNPHLIYPGQVLTIPPTAQLGVT